MVAAIMSNLLNPDISPYSASMKILFIILPMIYFLSFGLIYSIFVGAQSAGLICEEIEKGTMLILISKPIGRIQIFLGKFFAVFCFGALVSLLSTFVIGWFSVLIATANLEHFIVMVPRLWFIWFYSLYINLIFCSISMALSSIMKSGKKVGGIIIAIVLITFIGFFMIKMLAAAFYVKYYLYMVDIGYHLGYIFVLFNDFFGAIPATSAWQGDFNMYTGVFNAPSLFGGTGESLDSAQQIDLGGYPLNNYVTPLGSFLIWTGFSLLLLAFGLFKLKTREISN
jgi:ABC-type transport system involved in multi-copper enzyme maturation permease subunit